MIEIATIAMRIALLMLATAAITVNARAAHTLWQGSHSMADQGKAQIFFIAASVAIGQIHYLVIGSPAMLLLALLLAAIGLGLSLALRHRANKLGLTDLDEMIDNPQLVMPMLELARVDPEAAAALAHRARRALALRKHGE